MVKEAAEATAIRVSSLKARWRANEPLTREEYEFVNITSPGWFSVFQRSLDLAVK